MTDLHNLEVPLVVGGGVAGMTVALSLNGAVMLTTDLPGSSWWAQGGVSTSGTPNDRKKTERWSDLADPSAVERLVGDGPEAVLWLRRLARRLSEDTDETVILGAEGADGLDRAIESGDDATGAEVMRVLTGAVAASDSIKRLLGRAVDLITDGERIVGAVAVDSRARRRIVMAPAVVIATGGMGRLYSVTTNPPGADGSGIAMAIRAGARIADLEFMQFHPTAMAVSKDPLPLVTERLRDRGATLVDAHGRRFMSGIHPAAELAPRALLARAVWRQGLRGTGAYLDARHVLELADHHPTVLAHAMSVGIDPRSDLVPVSAAAHFQIGGIATDLDGRSSLPGLWAVGEAASTGLHGSSRLLSNALLEGLVFGRRAAGSVTEAAEPSGDIGYCPVDGHDLPITPGPAFDELRKLMWEHVGVERQGSGLWEAHNELSALEPVLRRTLVGRDAATLAIQVVAAALRRTESRGSHFRIDHQALDPSQARRVVVEPGPVEVERLV